MNNPESLKSDRLFFSKVEEKDLGFFRSYLTNPTLTRYLPLGEPYPEEEIKLYISELITKTSKHKQTGFTGELPECRINQVNCRSRQFKGIE